MKLSKSLLSAILIGIAVQTTVSSCEKDNSTEPKKDKQENKDGTKSDNPPSYCPACGMG